MPILFLNFAYCYLEYYRMKYLKPLIFTLVLLFAFSINIDAQQHLKFMGLPLTGTIDNFQAKLAAKGIYPDRYTNKTTPFGVRCFNGRFTGKQCTFFVYYTNTKKVYRAKAVYNDENEDLVDQFYNSTKEMLQTKYAPENSENDTYQNYPAFNVYVTNNEGTSNLGTINLYKTKYNNPYGRDSYSVHVDYTDYINGIDHDSENFDDL